MDDTIETPVVSASKAHYIDDPPTADAGGDRYNSNDPIKRSISRSRNSKPPSRYLDYDEMSPSKKVRVQPKLEGYEPPIVPLMAALPPTPATYSGTEEAALLLTVASSVSKPTAPVEVSSKEEKEDIIQNATNLSHMLEKECEAD